jgi:5-formyltetrahydrofolate cyclo-ligase
MESLAVVEQLRHIIARRAPKVVALFAPLWDEVQLQGLIDDLSCRVVLPRVEGDDMEFFDYTPTDLKEGSFGIMEPQGQKPCPASDIDLMVVPGVAFTKEGERLGRGKGFYDRYLSREGFRGFCIGVGYKHQLLDSLPTEPHDRQMDMVRLGIGLYGVSPIKEDAALKTVATLKTIILHTCDVPADETVGYSRKGTLSRPSRIAALPIGYADGLNC